MARASARDEAGDAMNVTMSEEEDMEEVEMEDVGMDEEDIEPHAYADLYHEHTPGPHEPKNAIEITLSKPKELSLIHI